MQFVRRVFQHTRFLRAAFAFTAGAMLIGQLGGCAADGDRVSYDNFSSYDDSFAEGADRPPTATTLYRMSRIFAAQGKDVKAETALLVTIDRYPEFSPAYSDLAQLYVRQRRFEDAIETLKVVQERTPDDPVVLNNLGMCYMLSSDYDNALAWFSEAAANDPENARYRANLATALGLLGRCDEAYEAFLAVVPLHDAHHNTVILARAAGVYDWPSPPENLADESSEQDDAIANVDSN